MQDESVIRNLIAEKGWRILSLDILPVTDTSKGKEGGIKLVLDTAVPKCPNVKYIIVPDRLSGQIKDGIIRTFVPRDILSLIRLLPSIMNHCSGYNSSNIACSLRHRCLLNREFFRKAKSRQLSFGLGNSFVGTAPFNQTSNSISCSSFIEDDIDNLQGNPTLL